MSLNKNQQKQTVAWAMCYQAIAIFRKKKWNKIIRTVLDRNDTGE